MPANTAHAYAIKTLLEHGYPVYVPVTGSTDGYFDLVTTINGSLKRLLVRLASLTPTGPAVAAFFDPDKFPASANSILLAVSPQLEKAWFIQVTTEILGKNVRLSKLTTIPFVAGNQFGLYEASVNSSFEPSLAATEAELISDAIAESELYNDIITGKIEDTKSGT